MQYTVYESDTQGHYTWHQDTGVNLTDLAPRKLSMVLQLSDPSEYEGGNLQVMTEISPQTVKKQRGLVAVFPSYVLHQVTPVTQGTRQSLVAWISGPQFK
jgi:PKHD-type hydroxylase